MHRIMSGKFITVFVSLILLAAMSGCASKGTLRSAYDDSVDFAQYTTYNYYEDTRTGASDYQSMFSQYMVTAIDKEMQSRGYTLSDAPDLLINYNIKMQEKTKVTTSPSMGVSMSSGGYYGYRRGYYDPWVGYGYGSDTHVSQYTEGTFNIDLVDPKLKRLVWEAVGVGRITEEKLENMREGVRDGVPRYFALFPFVAGDGTPHPAK